MGSKEYVLSRIASHRLCRIHGWDPEIVWGFAKGVALLKDEQAANGTRVIKLGSGNISVSAKKGINDRRHTNSGRKAL